MIDKNGKPLTDPRKASEGFLLPIGGPKGYGLSLIFGILAGTLNGAAFGRDVIDFNADSETTTNTGHFILALDINAFTDPEDFKVSMNKVWSEMKSSPRLPGVSDIRLPGERLERETQERTRNEIPINQALRAKLNEMAASLGTAPL